MVLKIERVPNVFEGTVVLQATIAQSDTASPISGAKWSRSSCEAGGQSSTSAAEESRPEEVAERRR